jgi:hypothetical protein
MPPYNLSTRGRIADIHSGLRVNTGSLANATYLLGAGNTQTELFTVKGLIWVRQLFLEVLVACSNNLTQVLFNCTFTTPVIGVNSMCAKCASIAQLGQGGRIVWLGGAVATAAVITDSPGLSDVLPATGQLVGGIDFVGSIGMLASDADQASGSVKATLHYFPLTEGAYAEALL